MGRAKKLKNETLEEIKKEYEMRREKGVYEKGTRLDTRQSSRGRFGRSVNAKTARNSEMLWTDGRTDRWMDGQVDGRTDRPTQQGIESRVRD